MLCLTRTAADVVEVENSDGFSIHLSHVTYHMAFLLSPHSCICYYTVNYIYKLVSWCVPNWCAKSTRFGGEICGCGWNSRWLAIVRMSAHAKTHFSQWAHKQQTLKYIFIIIILQ